MSFSSASNLLRNSRCMSTWPKTVEHQRVNRIVPQQRSLDINFILLLENDLQRKLADARRHCGADHPETSSTDVHRRIGEIHLVEGVVKLGTELSFAGFT